MANMIRKWVFSFDERSAGWFEEMIKVAVVSAKHNTTLEPLCLFDGLGTPPIIGWLKKQSVDVIRTRVPFHDELFSEETIRSNQGTSFTPQHAAGAYLRLYASDFVSDDVFLYTDCDVMFARDIEGAYHRPRIVAACGEMESDRVHSVASPDAKSFNSGVMVINRSGFLGVRDQIVDCARMHHFYHRKNSSYDQTILNMSLAGKWEPLSAEMNWRPFHGKNDDARIIHFHGPKPSRIAAILAGKASPEEQKLMREIVISNQEKYTYFISEYNRYLDLASSGF